jgi:ribosomal protein L44E
MSYSKKQPPKGMHMFNNVFVPRADYDAFRTTGSWPDKTVLLLENRRGITNRSILKHGQVQTEDLMGLEAHVKDNARFKGGWAFFSFDSKQKPAKRIAYNRSCYSCHLAHGAADTTFVQFYPTLFPVAAKLKTLSGGYLKDQKQAGTQPPG